MKLQKRFIYFIVIAALSSCHSTKPPFTYPLFVEDTTFVSPILLKIRSIPDSMFKTYFIMPPSDLQHMDIDFEVPEEDGRDSVK